jgi:four helix bundle protein
MTTDDWSLKGEAAMTQSEWEATVPVQITSDPLWRVEAYRLGLFLSDLAWNDCVKLLKERRTLLIADQLYRATGKISSNVGEGYSRNSSKERAHFYEYAQGSAREARDWYYKSRHVLGPKVTSHRLELTTSIAKLTVKMTASERRRNRKFFNE